MSAALYNVVLSSPKTLISEELVEIPFVLYMLFLSRNAPVGWLVGASWLAVCTVVHLHPPVKYDTDLTILTKAYLFFFLREGIYMSRRNPSMFKCANGFFLREPR